MSIAFRSGWREFTTLLETTFKGNPRGRSNSTILVPMGSCIGPVTVCGYTDPDAKGIWRYMPPKLVSQWEGPCTILEAGLKNGRRKKVVVHQDRLAPYRGGEREAGPASTPSGHYTTAEDNQTDPGAGATAASDGEETEAPMGIEMDGEDESSAGASWGELRRSKRQQHPAQCYCCAR